MKQPNLGYADVKINFACMHPAGCALRVSLCPHRIDRQLHSDHCTIANNTQLQTSLHNCQLSRKIIFLDKLSLPDPWLTKGPVSQHLTVSIFGGN